MTDADGTRWLRPGEVAAQWGVDRSTVSRMAERLGIRTKRLPTETRYHSGDVDRAHREMLGEQT